MLLPKPLEERVHGETGNKTLKVSDHRRTGPAAQRRGRQVPFPGILPLLMSPWKRRAGSDMPCFPVLRGSGAEGERWRRAAEAVGSIATKHV